MQEKVVGQNENWHSCTFLAKPVITVDISVKSVSISTFNNFNFPQKLDTSYKMKKKLESTSYKMERIQIQLVLSLRPDGCSSRPKVHLHLDSVWNSIASSVGNKLWSGDNFLMLISERMFLDVL